MKSSKSKTNTNGKKKKPSHYGIPSFKKSLSKRAQALKDASAKAPAKRKKRTTKKA